MTEKKLYLLEVSYPLREDWKETQKQIIDRLGLKGPDCSGAGFGQRDMDWHSLTKADCDRLAPVLREIEVEGLQYTFSEDTTE